MRVLLLFVTILGSMQVLAQQSFRIFRDSNTHELVYQGQVTFEELAREPDFKWLGNDARKYKPAAESVAYLEKHLRYYTITLIIGTWCEDTQEMLPRVYKIFKETGYPLQQSTMYGLDHGKKGLNKEELTYNVSNIPILILYKDNKEIGRITEKVKLSVEADLVAIIKDFNGE